MATNGNMDLVAYIYGFPGHLKIAGVQRHHTHIQEHLQAIQELSDHILSSWHIFESVSVRLAL